MKLFEVKSDYGLNRPYGVVRAKWNSEIFEEEDEGYLPDEYDHSKVLELQYIGAADGRGAELMDEFLDSPIAKSAELIFLDPNPDLGKFSDTQLSQVEQFDKLYRFYKKFGFESRYIGSRMWKVQKGSIEKKDLPT
jgi:hypothetical protein